jgi:hypothetical protein
MIPPILPPTTLLAATIPQPKTLPPLQQPQPAVDEIPRDARDCGGGAVIGLQPNPRKILRLFLLWTQALVELRRQFLELASRFVAPQPHRLRPELKPRRWDRHRKIWVARARAPQLLPWQVCPPAFFGASSARLSICAYSCL